MPYYGPSTPSGAAAGDLAGTYPNPTLSAGYGNALGKNTTNTIPNLLAGTFQILFDPANTTYDQGAWLAKLFAGAGGPAIEAWGSGGGDGHLYIERNVNGTTGQGTLSVYAEDNAENIYGSASLISAAAPAGTGKGSAQLALVNDLAGNIRATVDATGSGQIIKGHSGQTSALLNLTTSANASIFQVTGDSKVAFFGVTAVVRQSAWTQTYTTADKTVANMTASAVVTTAATNVAPYGFSEAQANAIIAAINALIIDATAMKKNDTALIDDLQAYGLEA